MASGNIKGIKIEIGGETTGLTKALNNVKKESNAVQKELKDVERLLKLDPKNTELLAQKQELLGQQINTTKDKLQALKTAKEKADSDMKNGTEVNEKQYRLLQREIMQTEQELKKLNEKITDSHTKFDALGKSADKMNSFMRTTGAVALGAGAGLVAMSLKAAGSADDINTLAKQTGLTTEQIQIFQYASDRIDVSLDTLTGSMAKLTKNMYSAQQGSKSQSQAFKALGVEILDNNGNLRNNQDVMNDCIDALSRMKNDTQRDAYAMQIFGKSAQDLNPLILGGADALKQMGEEARQSGVILDQDTLNAANEFNDAVDRLKATATGVFARIGSEVASQLTPLIEPLAGMIATFVDWIINNKDGVCAALAAIGAALLAFNVVTMIQGVIDAFTTWRAATQGMTLAQAALNLVMSLNPIALVVAAIAGLVAAFVVLWNKCEGFREFWTGLWDGIKNIASGAWDTIKDKAGPAIDGVKSMWGEAQPYFSAIWNGIKVAASVALENIAAYFKASWEIIKSVWDIAVSFFSTIWENIKLIFSVVGDVLSGDFSGAWEGIKQIWSNTADFFKTVWENIKNIFSTVINYFKTIFSNAWNGVKSVWSGAGAFFSNIVNNIASFFQELPPKLLKAGKDMITGLWNGINDKIAWLKGKVQGVVDTIKGWFTGKKGFDEHSPSKWSEKVFKYVMEGGKIGIEKNENKITDAIQNLIDNVKLKYELGIITEEAYYNAIVDIRDEYLEEGSSAWWNYTKELINYEKSIAESTKKEMQSTFQAVTDEAEKSMNDIESKQKSFLSKIRGNMAMYETRTVTIGEKSVSADVLTDWREKTAATQEYIGAITTLQNRVQGLFSIDEQGQFTEFMEMIRTEDAAEGRKITELLMGLTDADLSEYVSGWKEYLAVTESAADDTYAAEAESIKVGFFDKVLSMIQALPEEFRTQGEKAADFFGAALTEKINDILSGLNDMIVNSIPNMELNSLATGTIGVQRYYTTNQTKTSNITINSYVETSGASPYQASQANKAMISGLQKEGRL